MPDVVVVGAGVIGASVAWHLSRLGVRALLLEREPEPGKGSTGRATGGFRAQYGTDVNVRLSLLSREKLRRFIDDTGVDPGYDPRGYLWLARTEAQLAVLRGAQDVQRAAGLVEASMLDLRQIREVNPYIRIDGLAGAAFCPTDGYIRPLEILRGYLRGAPASPDCAGGARGSRRSSSQMGRRSRPAPSSTPLDPGRGRSRGWRVSTFRWRRCAGRLDPPSIRKSCPLRCR